METVELSIKGQSFSRLWDGHANPADYSKSRMMTNLRREM